MGQTGVRSTGQRAVGSFGCALFALVIASPVRGQTVQTDAAGSVIIEQPVGGSFALLASNQALTAVFRPRSLDAAELAVMPVRAGTFAYNGARGTAVGRAISYSADAECIAVHVLQATSLKFGQPLAFSAQAQASDRAQAILVLVNFN